jgi:hypothetical protein
MYICTLYSALCFGLYVLRKQLKWTSYIFVRLPRSSGGGKDWGVIDSFTVCLHGNHMKIWLTIGPADSGGLYKAVKKYTYS